MNRVILILLAFVLSYSHAFSEEDHAVHTHHAAMFIGGTTNTTIATEFNFTIGVDYEFRFIHTVPNFGIGILAEYVFADHNEFIIGLPLFVHPYKSLKLFVAPAYIKPEASSHAVVQPGAHGPLGKLDFAELVAPVENVSSSDGHFFVRLGAAYDFHVQEFSISPTICTDIIQGDLFLVYGIGLGIGF